MLCLWAFFGLPGLGACRLITLKARVFVERGVVWIRDLRVIRGLLIVGFARHGGTPIHDLLRVFIDEEDVFVGVCFLLAAIVLLLFGVILWTLAAACAPVNRQVGTAGACQITGRHTPRVALGGLPEVAQGLLQDWQEAMHPVVGLRLTQPTLQAMHRLQGVGLLIDQDEEKLVFTLRQCPWGAATDLPLTGFPFLRQVRGRLFLIGRLKRKQQLLKLVQLEPSCSQKFTWFVF